jgi:hypothetical protein
MTAPFGPFTGGLIGPMGNFTPIYEDGADQIAVHNTLPAEFCIAGIGIRFPLREKVITWQIKNYQ